MKEYDAQIASLYADYSAAKLVKEQSEAGKKTLVGKLVRVLNKRIVDQERQAEIELRRFNLDLDDAIRERPGVYPLEYLSYGIELYQQGFLFGFNYQLGDDLFTADYWTYNHHGLRVERHPQDYESKVEVRDPDQDVQDEDYGLTLLHLPEGIAIPVGPIHFKEEAIPLGEEQMEADEKAALAITRSAGINVPDEIARQSSEMVRTLFPHPVTYPDRFFYWQPNLPESRGRITIDFDSIKPEHLGTSWDNAPTLNNTKTPDPFA